MQLKSLTLVKAEFAHVNSLPRTFSMSPAGQSWLVSIVSASANLLKASPHAEYKVPEAPRLVQL